MCLPTPTKPAEIRKFLRTEAGAVWAYWAFLENGRRYEPLAALTLTHYNTIKKHVKRGQTLVLSHDPKDVAA